MGSRAACDGDVARPRAIGKSNNNKVNESSKLINGQHFLKLESRDRSAIVLSNAITRISTTQINVLVTPSCLIVISILYFEAPQIAQSW